MKGGEQTQVHPLYYVGYFSSGDQWPYGLSPSSFNLLRFDFKFQGKSVVMTTNLYLQVIVTLKMEGAHGEILEVISLTG